MIDPVADIARLLSPRVVAHIGASESGLYPADIFRGLLRSPLRAYAVNPGRSAVFGQPCLTSVGALPERAGDAGKADLAVITVPAPRVPGILDECIAAGISRAVVISAGFAEAGAEGRALQDQIEARRDRILVLGPNCAGFANVSGGIAAARLYSEARPGGIALVSQSGALMMALHGAFADQGAGLRAVVSVGNQAGYLLSDFVEFFAADPGCSVVAAFIEGVPDGDAFVRAARACRAAGKPLIAVKSGRSELGRRLAQTHTAALAGEGRVFEAVCRQHGIILVDDVADLVSVALVASTSTSNSNSTSTSESGARAGRIAWIAQSGGLGSLAGDLASAAGIAPEAFPPELGGGLNPLDVGGDLTRGAAAGETLAPFLAHPEIGAAVLLFAKNPFREVEAETARSIVDARAKSGKPVYVVWVGPTVPPRSADAAATAAEDPLRILREAGIPVFASPGPLAKALGALAAWRRSCGRAAASPVGGSDARA